jgi:hypothetical protein
LPIALTNYPAEPFNSYASLDFFKERLDIQLRSYVGKTDDQMSSALIQATEYANIRFAFNGYPKIKGQSNQFPREECYDNRGDRVEGIPLALQRAVCEYAWMVLNGKDLMPDPVQDERGQVVKSISEKVGPLATDIEYEVSQGQRFPSYPKADGLLYSAGLVRRRGGFSVGHLAIG